MLNSILIVRSPYCSIAHLREGLMVRVIGSLVKGEIIARAVEPVKAAELEEGEL